MKSLLFKTHDVLATIAGRKTAHLVEINPQPIGNFKPVHQSEEQNFVGFVNMDLPNPYDDVITLTTPYTVGQIVPIKEAFTVMEPEHCASMKERFAYRADTPKGSEGDGYRLDYIKCGYPYQWRSSQHMPLEAARIWVEITNVTTSKLISLTEQDAVKAGIQFTDFGTYQNGSISVDGGKTYKPLKPQQHRGWHWQDKVSSHEQCLATTVSALANSLGAIHSLTDKWYWLIEYKVLSTTGKPNNL